MLAPLTLLVFAVLCHMGVEPLENAHRLFANVTELAVDLDLQNVLGLRVDLWNLGLEHLSQQLF